MLAAVGPLGSTGRGQQVCPRLIAVAEEFYDIPVGSIKDKKRRNGNISLARWAVFYALENTMGWSQPRIAKELNKDQASVWYGLKQSEKLLRTNELFDSCVRLLKREILPHDGPTHI